MAGCNSNKETELKSYQDLTETVKAQHVDWSPPQIRREAAKIFRPQHQQNADSTRRELSGAKEYDGTDFTYTAVEGIRFRYGDGSMGLLEFHERQLRLTPKAYSETQHQTSLLIDEAFRGGANKVATSYLEPGGQRDIVVMTLDRATGKGKMRIINTVSDHTMPEMQNLVKKTFLHLSEVHPTTNAFILCDTYISKEQIQQKFTTLDRQVHVVPKETVGAAKNTIREIQYTVASVDKFIQRSRDDRLKAHLDVIGESFIHRVRRVFEHREDKKGEALVFHHQQEQHKGVEKINVKKQEVNILGRSIERVKRIQQNVREKIATSIATLLFVRATGVGIGGAFAQLESIARLPHISLESPKRTRKEKVKKQKYKEISLKRKRTLEKMRVLGMNEGTKKLAKKEQHALHRKEKVLRAKEKKLLQRKEQRSIQRKETVFRRKEKKLLQRKEQKSLRRKEKQLWKMLKRLVQMRVFSNKEGVERRSLSTKIKRKEKIKKIYISKKEKQTIPTLTEHSKRQERQHIIDFSVALVIWFLLHMQIASHPSKEKRNVLRVTKREKLNVLTPKEPAPWLLFAIIWHLAMIREQGMRRGLNDPRYNKKTVQKKKIFPRAMLPPVGVIFAFHP